MQLTEFIEKIKNDGIFSESSEFSSHYIYHFKYRQEKSKGRDWFGPQVFFSFFIKKFKEILSLNSSLNTEIMNLPSLMAKESYLIKSKLETTFLGQKNFYFLTGLQDLKAKESLGMIDYLENYTGPNFVAFFSDDSVNLGLNKNKIVIDLPSNIDQKIFLMLSEFFFGSQIVKSKSFSKIVSDVYLKNFELNIDDACIIINHAYFAGSSYKEFLGSWFNKIVLPDKSLFTLSQYFFDRNSKDFLKLWFMIMDDFPEQFWIAFWSEQVWRACNFVRLTKEKKLIEAKKVSFKLPFSFINRSCRNFTVQELINAHKFIYLMDYNMKNGGGQPSSSIDLFYSKFFSGEFKLN